MRSQVEIWRDVRTGERFTVLSRSHKRRIVLVAAYAQGCHSLEKILAATDETDIRDDDYLERSESLERAAGIWCEDETPLRLDRERVNFEVLADCSPGCDQCAQNREVGEWHAQYAKDAYWRGRAARGISEVGAHSVPKAEAVTGKRVQRPA